MFDGVYSSTSLQLCRACRGGEQAASSKQQRQRALNAIACVFHTVLFQCPSGCSGREAFLAPLTALQPTCRGYSSYTATGGSRDGREMFSTLLAALHSTCRDCRSYTLPRKSCDGRELCSTASTALQLYNPAGLAGGRASKQQATVAAGAKRSRSSTIHL